LNYDGKCRHLHGHNGRVDIELASDTLDARGMVMDFTEVKQQLQDWLDTELDHRMLLNRADPIRPILEAQKEPLFLMEMNPTAEAIARLIFERAAAMGFPVTEVRMWESDSSFATYRQSPQ
jgi:6-pyruvoyltetrahydropterin/6-carboxytetrahydropterin synthase